MKEYKSSAKVNIGLHIISKRPDGYHNIETIFYPINLYDHLTFIISNSFSIETNNLTVPIDETNLIFKAKRILEEYTCRNFSIKVKLEKNIPIFSGLGGGSSNAATTLKALNELYDLRLSKEELLMLASKIGSDVSFFVLGEPSFAQGRGEILTPIKNLKFDFQTLIVFPNIKISTHWAYSKFKQSTKKIELSMIKTSEDFLKNKELITNDFETIVFEYYPEIEKIKESLLNSGAIFASMTGSGSAVFGFFEKDFDMNLIKSKFSNYLTFMC